MPNTEEGRSEAVPAAAVARKRLNGRVAVITGGTSGIGRAIATAFAAEGAKVLVVGRDAGRGSDLIKRIEAANGQAAFCDADVTRVSDCERAILTAVDRWGKLDILVNSAGVFPLGPTTEVTEDEFDKTISANLKGAFFCGQAAIRHMVERGGGGRIINLSSIAAVIGFAGAALYSLTKGGLLTLTKAWAVEYAPQGILVNAIAPGNVETPMNAALMAQPDYKAAMLSQTPLGRNGQVSDIVPAAVMLAGDEGSFFCGATLVIDGGWVAK